MKKTFLIIMVFASFAMKSYGFQSGDLLYTIISNDPPCVRLDGHIDGQAAQGELIIPETVTHEDVVYTVTTIKENAFYMSHITSVVFPAGLTTIEAYAFESCHLTSLHIPATLTSIGGYAFVDNKFESITVDEANPIYDSRNNCNALIETATNTLITGCINTIIPHSVVVLGSGAFIHCERLKYINIPECITRIENNVFEDCDSLETVVLPASLTFIGNHAFCYCYGITSITSKATTPPAATYNPNDPYYYDTFLGVNRTIPIYIPFGTTQAYSQAPGWNCFSNFIEEDPILYTDYEPDSCITDQYTRLWVDFDDDGYGDICLKMDYTSTGYWPEIVASENWEITWLDDDNTDTIPNISHWGQTYLWLDDEDQSRFAARKQIENGNYLYVWFEAYVNVTFNPFVCHLCFDKYGYCLIPNYPLTWGQTNIPEGVEENKETNGNTFAVYPNPANGILFVETRLIASLPDQNEYHITNMMGQTLLRGCINTETQQIDIANLPMGMYFISVGRQTMKFVKQ